MNDDDYPTITPITFTRTMSRTITMTAQDIADIIGRASMASGYWNQGIDELRDGVWKITCHDIEYNVSYDDVINSLVTIASNNVMAIEPDVIGHIVALIQRDGTFNVDDIDGTAADALLQVAIFGTIVY